MEKPDQRVVGQQVPDAEEQVELGPCLGCERRAFGNLSDPVGHCRNLWPILVTDHHPDLSEIGNHVRRHASRLEDVVKACRGQDMFAHLVDGVAKQLSSIEGGTPVPGRVACMRRASTEDDADAVVCRRPDGPGRCNRGRVPCKRGVHVVEQTVAHHADLDALRLLGCATIDADRAGCAIRLHHAFQRKGRSGAAGAEQVVSAGVAHLDARRARCLARLGGISEAGQRIVFGK